MGLTKHLDEMEFPGLLPERHTRAVGPACLHRQIRDDRNSGYEGLGCRGEFPGESPSQPPALLPFHAAGFPTSRGGVSTERRMVIDLFR